MAGTRYIHVEGDLVIAGKDRLFMYFMNTLPLLRLLDGRRVVFLIPLPRYILVGCCEQADHAPNRADPDFEDSIRAGLVQVRGFFKDFLFSSNLRGFRLLNPGLCGQPSTLTAIRCGETTIRSTRCTTDMR